MFGGSSLALVFLLVGSSAAQQIRFEDFSSVSNLQFNGSSHQATWQSQKVLRLTDGSVAIPHGAPQAAAAYFNVQQPLTSGFTSWFDFQIHNPTACCSPGDGFSFIIQNSTATDPATEPVELVSPLLAGAAARVARIRVERWAMPASITIWPWSSTFTRTPGTRMPATWRCRACGTNTNTPVHMTGDYTIGTHRRRPELSVHA